MDERLMQNAMTVLRDILGYEAPIKWYGDNAIYTVGDSKYEIIVTWDLSKSPSQITGIEFLD